MRIQIAGLYLILGLLLATSQTVFAKDMKVGVVNAALLLENAPQADAARGSLEKEFAPRDKKLVAQQKEIKRLEEKLARDAAVMSSDGRKKIERDILSKKRDVKRAQEEFREDFNIRRNEVLADLQREVMETIRSLAKREKYDIIFSDGVLYAGDNVDITDDVLQQLKANFKSGKKK